MCNFCRSEIFYNEQSKSFEIPIQSMEWNEWADGFVDVFLHDVKYCPYCGNMLKKEEYYEV